LGGQWDYYSTNKSIRGHGLVPGDIYSDLYRSKVISEPLFGDNHLDLAWIGAENWTYSRTFTVDPSLMKYRTVLLLLKGVDTVSTVTLNDDILLNTTNQFVEYHVDLFGSLKTKNTIEVRFTSPVLYAKEKSDEYYVSSSVR
uniref:Beta-galactosidase n=1 Tax=Haemonchus placei TaxID=6290 RepID=A0A0N4WJ50_HAEPC